MNDPQPHSRFVLLTYVIYGLHLFSATAGLVSTAFVVTAFLSGWPSIVAVVLNYFYRSDIIGTFLESHFIWQIRTFWFAVFWFAVMILFAITIIGIPLAYILGVGLGLWVLYRMIRGLLTLLNENALPLPE